MSIGMVIFYELPGYVKLVNQGRQKYIGILAYMHCSITVVICSADIIVQEFN